jgi:hypothetical protein
MQHFLKGNTMKIVAIQHVAKGDYVKRKVDSKAVYVKGDYCRIAKAYEMRDTDDVNRVIYIKADKVVVTGFTY